MLINPLTIKNYKHQKSRYFYSDYFILLNLSFFALDYSLVSIGLISFVIIAQLGPSFLAPFFGEEVLGKALYGEC